MNIKSILLSALAVVIVSTVAITFEAEKKQNSYYAKEKAEKAREEGAEAAGSSAFFHQMRANPLTNRVEVEDVERVIQQVNRQRYDANKTTALATLEWEERGPNNIGGRTRGMVSDRNDPNKLYMGMVTGGFFTSTDRGNTWVKMAGMDSAARISVSCMTQAANGDIYYGTGESFAEVGGVGHFSGIPGGGVFKSTDGGVSSVNLPQTKPSFNSDNQVWSHVNRLVAHPTDPNHIYAGISRGFYETKDGGNLWTKVVNSNAPVLDISVSSSGNVVLASTANQMYLSTDGGANFTLGINNSSYGLPGTSRIVGQDNRPINRIEVEIAPSDENIMYCVMSELTNPGNSDPDNETRGIYKSVDKGQSWTAIAVGGSQTFNPLGTQGTYNIALGVHPTNPDMIFVGGQLDLYRYTPQALWEPIAYWQGSIQNGAQVHADMHGIMFNSGNPDEMYVVTDGGFYRTADCTVPNPFFIEKNKDYATAQCYGVAANDLGHIIFGTQDNGTSILNGSIANSPNSSIDAMGGDGMRGAASDIDPDFFYGTTQRGGLRGASDGGSSVAAFTRSYDDNIDAPPTATSQPNGLPNEGSNWIAPVTLAELRGGTASESVLLIGLTQRVWFTQQAIGTKPKVWFPLMQNGNSAGDGSSGFSAIAVSKDGKTVFAGMGNGALYRITGVDLFGTRYQYDDTVSNLLSSGFAGDSNFVVTQLASPWGGLHITDLECDSSGNELIITVPRYGVSTHVYRSLNALSPTPTISNIQGNLPPMPVYSAAILKQSNSYLVGTDLGVWGTDNGGLTWTELNNISGQESQWHPRIPTMQIAVKPFLSTPSGGHIGEIIYTGTYGRGTFVSKTRAVDFFPTSTTDIQAKTNNLTVYPNPVGSTAHIKYDVRLAGEAMIQVISLNGGIIKTTFGALQVGENKLNVDLSGVSKGIYMISVTSENGTEMTKIVKR